MLHDVIPLEYPHLVSSAAVAHHARMVRTVARHADCLIFNSKHAKERVDLALRSHGRMGVPNLVRWLPLPDASAKGEASIPELAEVDYFVVVSTIEPRKNHDLLVRVWRRLVSTRGLSAPHLIIIGSLGYKSEEICASYDREPLLKSRIHLISGLSSQGLAALVLGANGLLSPSFAEGFGLPVLEAKALGVPVLASDIAAHREIGGAHTELLPTDDEESWEIAILRLMESRFRTSPSITPDLIEDSYCADILRFLKRVAEGPI